MLLHIREPIKYLYHHVGMQIYQNVEMFFLRYFEQCYNGIQLSLIYSANNHYFHFQFYFLFSSNFIGHNI